MNDFAVWHNVLTDFLLTTLFGQILAQRKFGAKLNPRQIKKISGCANFFFKYLNTY